MVLKLWKIGENRAADYLDKKGYKILARNYRCRYGEIDIIVSKSNKISFVEVKTRTSLLYGYPCEAVDYKKINHIKRTAFYYICQDSRKYESMSIDIIEVIKVKDNFYIRHLENITQ